MSADHVAGRFDVINNSISCNVDGKTVVVEVVVMTSSCSLVMSLIVSSRTERTSEVGVACVECSTDDELEIMERVGSTMVKDVLLSEEFFDGCVVESIDLFA